MKRLLFLIAFTTIFAYTQAQQRIELSNQFYALEVEGNLRVQITPTDSLCSTVLEVYGIDAKRVQIKQKGPLLTISFPSGFAEEKAYADVFIKCPTLMSITSKGATIINFGTLKTASLKITAITSANALNLNLESEDITVDASGSCNMLLSGTTNTFTIKANLGARVDSRNLAAQNVTVSAGAMADVIVRPLESLDTKVSTKATIYYIGSPTLRIKKSLSGGVIPVTMPAPVQVF